MRARTRPSRTQAVATSLGSAAIFSIGYLVGDVAGVFRDRGMSGYGVYFAAVTGGAFVGNRFWTRRLPTKAPGGPPRVADYSTR